MIIHRGVRFQRGRGLFSTIFRFIPRLFGSNAFKKVAGITAKAISSPIGQSVKKAATKSLKKGAINLAKKHLRGQSLKSSIRQEISDAKKQISKAIESSDSRRAKRLQHNNRPRGLLD